MQSASTQKICVLGLGYIGLPTASLLATKGFQVFGVDTNSRIVTNLNEGKVIIQEPSLDVMVKSAVQSGNLTASETPKAADIFIVAVPTPFKDDHKPDLNYVEQATRSLSKVLVPGNLVILESTSPVGTTEKMAQWIKEERPGLSVSSRGNVASKDSILLAHCPERVLPGQILHELVHNDRVVGGIDQESTESATTFYRSFVAGKILPTDSRTAELTKLTENVFRDVNIALANELSIICDKLDINVWKLIELANHHPRVNILNPGPGVGGHCIAVDPWFVVDAAPEEARLIRVAREVNDFKPEHIVEKVLHYCTKNSIRTVACLGLAYKADVDDLRESPAIEITKRLLGSELEVLVVEPYVQELPNDLKKFNMAKLVKLEVAVQKSEVLLVLVDHKEFKLLDKAFLKGKAIFDTRGIWSK